MSSSQQLLDAVEAWKVEDEKFTNCNASAGTRARKTLQEIAKLLKARKTKNT